MTRDIRTSLFPHMPRSNKFMDSDGEITEHWYLSLMNLYQTLQATFTSTGFRLPQVDESAITAIQNKYVPYIGAPLPKGIDDISGLTLFDATNRVPKIFIITYNGQNVLTAAWKTFSLV